MPVVKWIACVLALLAGCGEGELSGEGQPFDPRLDAEPAPLDGAPFLPDAGMAPRDGAPPTDARPAEPDSGAPTSDAGPTDGRVLPPDAEPPDVAPLPEEGPAVYTSDRTLSPITPFVAAHLRAIAERAPELSDDVFAKVGASATVSRSFLHCFAGEHVDLGDRDELQAAIDHFLGGDAGGTDPFTRESLTATVGWSAVSAVSGSPSPLEQEVAAIRPRFAVVMYGTNDIQRRDIFGYADNMLELVDTLTSLGVIPVLSSIMPRDDDAEADAMVPHYNAVVRGVAQARQIPFVDLHRELLPLPDHGLSGDHLHPGTYRTGRGARPCHLTPDGLQFGYNVRNLITIRTLSRLISVVLDAGGAPDPPHRRSPADGTRERPFVVDHFPFTDLRDTRRSPSSVIDRYDGCEAMQDESGPELFYRVDVVEPVVVTAWVFDRGSVDIDLHLLDASAEPAGCLDRAHQKLEASLEAGTYYFALDSFVSGGSVRSGAYLFVLVAE